MKETLLIPFHYYSQMAERLYSLERKERELANRIKKYPPGKLHIFCRGKEALCYLREKPSETPGRYIRKSEVEKINLYLQKYYDEKVYRLVQHEIKSLAKFLETSRNLPTKIQKIYSSIPEPTRANVSPIDISNEEYAAFWLAIPYEKKEMGDDVPNYISDRGEHVRSKSELNIANALAKAGVPYKYECPLKFRSGIIYPDFTVLNVRERKVIYWEHRGMMDDANYQRHTVKRIKEYQANKIFLGDGLVITEENSVTPLGTDEIQGVIKHYFL